MNGCMLTYIVSWGQLVSMGPHHTIILPHVLKLAFECPVTCPNPHQLSCAWGLPPLLKVVGPVGALDPQKGRCLPVSWPHNSQEGRLGPASIPSTLLLNPDLHALCSLCCHCCFDRQWAGEQALHSEICAAPRSMSRPPRWTSL